MIEKQKKNSKTLSSQNATLRNKLDDAVVALERQNTDMDDIRKKSQGVYKKLQELDDQEVFGGDQQLPGRSGRGGRHARSRGRREPDVPKIYLPDIKKANPKLYNDIIDDVIQEYGDEDDIPEDLPLSQLSSKLRQKVADCMKAIEGNKALEGVKKSRVNEMLKHLGKPTPADGEELITPEEATELIDKYKNKLINLKGDELRALKKIAMNDPNYELEDVSLDNQESRKLKKALDAAEIDLEELKREHPELYNELKRDIADIIAATGRVPKSLKASEISPELAQKLG